MTTQGRCSRSPSSRPMVGRAVGDDGLVEGREEHREQDADEDRVDVLRCQRHRQGIGSRAVHRILVVRGGGRLVPADKNYP